MLKAFIIDDEPLARDELQFLLKRTKQVKIVGEADNLEDAMEILPTVNIDCIFLDIQLGNESGIELVDFIEKLPNKPDIIFATAFDEYALKAFELNALDYLLKPFDEERIAKTISKLQRKKQPIKHTSSSISNNQKVETTHKLAVTLEDRIILLNIDDIIYCSVQDGKTIIVTKETSYQVTDSLITLEKKLYHKGLLRVHRAFLVNPNFIKEIQPWFHSTYNLIMYDHSSVPVSRTYTKEIRQIFNL